MRCSKSTSVLHMRTHGDWGKRRRRRVKRERHRKAIPVPLSLTELQTGFLLTGGLQLFPCKVSFRKKFVIVSYSFTSLCCQPSLGFPSDAPLSTSFSRTWETPLNCNDYGRQGAYHSQAPSFKPPRSHHTARSCPIFCFLQCALEKTT